MPGEKRDFWGGFFGIVVFLVGIGLIAFTFQQALGIFSAPPQVSLEIKENQPINVNRVAEPFGKLIMQILLMVVMAWIGSVIANRGIKMYSAQFSCKIVLADKEPKKEESPTSP